jgi:hypothetical protein
MPHDRRILTALAILLGTSCLSTESSLEPLPTGGHHVLFVGNSLTYTNDLPSTVAAIAASAGDTIRVAMEAGADLALIDHLTGGTSAVARIAQGGWEYVVLQQGPTPAGICRDSLVLWTKMFDAKIRAVGAKPAVLMVWPIIGVGPPFDDVRVSFQMATQAVNGVFLPAGEAWRAALRADSSIGVYGADGFHPSPTGTFLTALEIYERVTGRDPRSLPPLAFSNGRPLSLPEATIRALQSAAHEANTTFPSTPGVAYVPSASPSTPSYGSHC